MLLRVAMGATVFGLALLPTASLAQEKTAKACQQEWRANKADFQAKGITEKAYVAQCHAGNSPAQSASPAAANSGAAPSGPAGGKPAKACQQEWRANKADFQAKGITEKAYVVQCRAGNSPAQSPSPAAANPGGAPSGAAGGKSAKACQEEWRANKAAYQAANVTERAYVAKCRAGETVALPGAAPGSAPPAPAAAAPANPPAATAAKPRGTVAAPSQTGANQFAAESQAKAHCPSDVVVWANLTSKIYHFAGYKNYGNTEHGAYMCEKDATAQGFRASKTEKHPGA